MVIVNSVWVGRCRGGASLPTGGSRIAGRGRGAFFEQQRFQPIQAGVPEGLVSPQPFVGCAQRCGIQMAHMDAAKHLARDEAGAFERLDVLGRRRQRHAQRLGQLANGLLALRQAMEHLPPRRVTQGVEDGIELGFVKFNHVVECMARIDICQPIG
jgi:hypothetical protein